MNRGFGAGRRSCNHLQHSNFKPKSKGHGLVCRDLRFVLLALLRSLRVHLFRGFKTNRSTLVGPNIKSRMAHYLNWLEMYNVPYISVLTPTEGVDVHKSLLPSRPALSSIEIIASKHCLPPYQKFDYESYSARLSSKDFRRCQT